jgi:hypothetical protein
MRPSEYSVLILFICNNLYCYICMYTESLFRTVIFSSWLQNNHGKPEERAVYTTQ